MSFGLLTIHVAMYSIASSQSNYEAVGDGACRTNSKQYAPQSARYDGLTLAQCEKNCDENTKCGAYDFCKAGSCAGICVLFSMKTASLITGVNGYPTATCYRMKEFHRLQKQLDNLGGLPDKFDNLQTKTLRLQKSVDNVDMITDEVHDLKPDGSIWFILECLCILACVWALKAAMVKCSRTTSYRAASDLDDLEARAGKLPEVQAPLDQWLMQIFRDAVQWLMQFLELQRKPDDIVCVVAANTARLDALEARLVANRVETDTRMLELQRKLDDVACIVSTNKALLDALEARLVANGVETDTRMYNPFEMQDSPSDSSSWSCVSDSVASAIVASKGVDMSDCFMADDIFKTRSGEAEFFLRAELLQKGSCVLAVDDKTVLEVVEQPTLSKSEKMIELQAADATLCVTPDHRVPGIKQGDWEMQDMFASDLKEGDVVFIDGVPEPLINVKEKTFPGGIDVIKIAFNHDLPVAVFSCPSAIASKGTKKKRLRRSKKGVRTEQKDLVVEECFSIPDTGPDVAPWTMQ